MMNFDKILFVLVAVATTISGTSIGETETDELEHFNDALPMSAVLFRNKREDIIKFLVDAVDDDIDKCGSPLQLQKSQVTISVQSLTCIVQALVDSLNAGPGLLRKLLDNLLKKRDTSAVEIKTPLTRAEQACAMKAIIKEAIDVVKEQHAEERRRHKRRAHGGSNDRCAEIEEQIEDAMRKQMTKKKMA